MALSLIALPQLKSSIVIENWGAGLRAIAGLPTPRANALKPSTLLNSRRFMVSSNRTTTPGRLEYRQTEQSGDKSPHPKEIKLSTFRDIRPRLASSGC